MLDTHVLHNMILYAHILIILRVIVCRARLVLVVGAVLCWAIPPLRPPPSLSPGLFAFDCRALSSREENHIHQFLMLVLAELLQTMTSLRGIAAVFLFNQLAADYMQIPSVICGGGLKLTIFILPILLFPGS